jgi:hypothetical protein
MIIRVWVPDAHRVSDPTDTGMGTIFYLWVTPVPDSNRIEMDTERIFFSLVGNLMGTRYFTTAIILVCESENGFILLY